MKVEHFKGDGRQCVRITNDHTSKDYFEFFRFEDGSLYIGLGNNSIPFNDYEAEELITALSKTLKDSNASAS